MPPSDTGSWTSNRPDRPLVVKATFDRLNKRISFDSARNCTYDILRTKVERCFALSASSYLISYKDDDGEVTDITTDTDLDEAIQYFQAGVDDLPVSSAQSILSGRSFGSRKITMRVTVTVEFDGRLSDTSSLASLDEYKDRNGSEYSLSFSSAVDVEPEDDSVTISSRDTGRMVAKSKAKRSIGLWKRDIPSAIPDVPSLSGGESEVEDQDEVAEPSDVVSRYPEDPTAVFERLKLSESSLSGSTEASERRAQWLRDQRNGKVIDTVPESAAAESVSDGFSLSLEGDCEDRSLFNGDLALQRDNSGKYYYAFRSSASSASLADAQPDQWMASKRSLKGISSMSKSTENPSSGTYPSTASSSRPASLSVTSEAAYEAVNGIHPDIPPEVLGFLDHIDHCPPPSDCTRCSECDVTLDSFRYVCSTCGEKAPRIRLDPGTSPQSNYTALQEGKGKERDVSEFDPYAYPPSKHRTHSSSSPASSASSWTLLAADSEKSPKDSSLSKPLPPRPLPNLPSGFFNSSSSTIRQSPDLRRSPSALSAMSSPEVGYELCVSCIEHAGVMHAAAHAGRKSASDANGSEPSSPEEVLSQWSRSAPKEKGHFRHAFIFKVWGPGGWKDVEHAVVHECSTCNRPFGTQQYRCASCENIVLCSTCYSQVHEIHPRHAFLVVTQNTGSNENELQFEIAEIPTDDGLGLQSMSHEGVRCAHCLQHIVGALFHCAACEATGKSVDICSNCESAGLPGNLDAPDGGHNSSHIMIKIPVPMNTSDIQAAGRRALQLWLERDSVNVHSSNGLKPRRNSVLSTDGVTVMGSNSRPSQSQRSHSSSMDNALDHRITCKACRKNIVGVRYQCATCPSTFATQYSLCAQCEERSYMVHDPMHIFFKLPRPVDRPIESQFPILPLLYKQPAGPQAGSPNPSDPKAYLQDVEHSATLCDCCMDLIRGEWFRCAYCAKDLCSVCETIDEHDKTHLFFVFKAPVDMRTLRIVAALDSNDNPPVLKYPVYFA